MNVFKRIFSRQRVEPPAPSPANLPEIRVAFQPREVTVTFCGKPLIVGAVGYASAIWGSAQEWADGNLIKCPVC